MKKLAIIIFATLLVIAFAMPASALESIFGGYWRTRAYSQRDFTGNDNEQQNVTQVDTRTRLYYTAVLNDNLKFVNKFEFNAVWGDDEGGDIGADGDTFRVKNSYVDFNVGPVNGKVGIQGTALARGFLFDDDFAGAVISFNGEGFSLPLIWMRPYENSVADEDEVDYFGVAPSFKPNENFSLTPFILYAYSNDARKWASTANFEELNMYYGGVELEAKAGPASIWMTGIYQSGEANLAANTNQSVDFKAWLAAAGASVDLGGKADVHGQAFYATGPDEEDAANNERSDFFVPKGQSYYWAEIMGYGTFDNQVSAGSPGDQIGNIMVGNIGTTIKPMSDLKISLDAWYAKYAEEIVMPDGTMEDELGIEANVTITYTLVEGLDLDLVGAYLFAGDATTMQDSSDKNPYEIGTRLSLSF
ncbi:MAG: alginate export family protein [Desulfobacteraceae bacterium]|nr:alginate export family protein [Desulfobacteraceae bacterium]